MDEHAQVSLFGVVMSWLGCAGPQLIGQHEQQRDVHDQLPRGFSIVVETRRYRPARYRAGKKLSTVYSTIILPFVLLPTYH